jgi:hypothetical protein
LDLVVGAMGVSWPSSLVDSAAPSTLALSSLVVASPLFAAASVPLVSGCEASSGRATSGTVGGTVGGVFSGSSTVAGTAVVDAALYRSRAVELSVWIQGQTQKLFEGTHERPVNPLTKATPPI